VDKDVKAEKERRLGICVISFPMPSFWVVSVFLLDLIKILEPIANEIHIITKNTSLDTPGKKVRIYNTKLSLHFRDSIRPKILSLVYQLFKIVFIQIIMCCYLIRIIPHANIIIFYVGGIFLILPMVIAKLFRKKVDLFAMGRGPAMRGMSHKITKFVVVNAIFKIIIDFLFKLLYKLPDKIILESEKELLFLGFEEYSDKVDGRGARYIDTDIFSIKKRITERKNIIGFLSRLTEEKGVVNLVEAVPFLLNAPKNIDGNIAVMIYGDGPLKNELNKIIQEKDLKSYIQLKGRIPSHDMVASALNDFKLLVLPSNFEGLPTIILEAMACGTPVLATPVGSIPAVIKEGETGFILEDNSPECIAQNLIRVLGYPNLDEIIRSAHKLIMENYTYEAAVERYRQMVESKRTGDNR
jgi:glycosyltransferase involved in cell wall biosynthesis